MVHVRCHWDKLALELHTNVCKSLADKLHQPVLLLADVKLQYESAGLENFLSLQASPHLKLSRLRQKSILTKKKKERKRENRHHSDCSRLILDFVARTAKANERCCSYTRRILSGRPLLQRREEIPEDSVRVNKLRFSSTQPETKLKLSPQASLKQKMRSTKPVRLT